MLTGVVEKEPSALDRVLGALPVRPRRAMLRRLAGGARTVGELAEPFEMSFAAAAKHVKVLEEAGLLSRTIEGRSHPCRIEAGPPPHAHPPPPHYPPVLSPPLDRPLTRPG